MTSRLSVELDLITVGISDSASPSSCQPASLTYATLKKQRRKSHVDTLGRGFLKNSSKHSKSVASLLCETGDVEEITASSGGLERSPGAKWSDHQLEVESGYSSIENNHSNHTLTDGNYRLNNHSKSIGVTNLFLVISLQKHKKIAKCFWFLLIKI